MADEHFDVLIVGAGLSGICAAHHLQRVHPHRSFALLEGREELGGTWSLFRYPGVRSDSDMHTLGFRFRPWPSPRAIADGPAILDYLHETSAQLGIDDHIRYRHKVVRADWSSARARWRLDVETPSGTDQVTCDFLLGCTGYYRYDCGYSPDFPGIERFGGDVIHPQDWPAQLDYTGKRVVVIGSGATAMTLVPAMAGDAAKVTMLQRSPSYVATLPRVDPIAEAVRKLVPERLAYGLVRWKNILLQLGFFELSRRRPEFVKRLLRRGLDDHLPADFDVDRHFTPRYNPWDQRLCLVPDADLFESLSRGDAEIVTDTIAGFTETGIELGSGGTLEADVIVTATGLQLQLLGGIDVAVDGTVPEISGLMTYKAMMLEGVPNLAFSIGYTNASWTLKADLTAEYVCRVLEHMDREGHRVCVPVNDDPSVQHRPLLDFTSGYVQRSLHELPKSGSKRPWRLRMNYPADVIALRHGRVDDGVLRFSGPYAMPAETLGSTVGTAPMSAGSS